MGFQTDLFTTLTFNRMTFNSKYDVESELDHTEKLINYYEIKLQTLGIITEPKKFCIDDEDPLTFINTEISNTLKELKDLYIDQYKLELVLDTWDKSHDENGYAIPYPSNISWDTAYLDGDFIKHKKEDE